MKIDTTRFGEIEVEENKIITFPNSLLGFDNCKAFVMVPNPNGGPLEWMQSVKQSDLAFVVCDPQCFVPDYQFAVQLEELEVIQATNLEEVQVKAILRVPPQPQKPTINLMGPLFFNKSKMLGMQYVVNNPKWSCRHEIGG